MVTWARVMLLLTLALAWTAPVRGAPAGVVKALALEAANITLDALQREGGACTGAFATTTSDLQQELEDAANAVLDEHSCICHATPPALQEQVSVRIQLDTCALGPRMQLARDTFNHQQPDIYLQILQTPVFNSTAEIIFNRPSMPADGRWTDYIGSNAADLSIYQDDNNHYIHNYMYYRRDIFDGAALAVPQSWRELIDVVKVLNDTDFDGDGLNDYALCFNFGELCLAPYFMIQGIITMTNYRKGISNSWVFDPTTMQPRGNNAAVRAALELAATLNAYNNPLASMDCYPYSDLFCKGKCAITFNSDQFVQTNKEGCRARQGLLGVALVPGSTHVLNFTSDTLVPCTPDLCPFAVPSQLRKGTWINQVPFHIPVLYNLMPNPTSDSGAAAALGSFALYFSRHYASYYDAYNRSIHAGGITWNAANETELDIVTAQTDLAAAGTQIAPPVPTDPRPLLQLGYNLMDTASLLYIDAQILAFKNQYRGTKLPGGAYFRIALGEAGTRALQPGANLTDIMRIINWKFSLVVPAFGDANTYRTLYWASIGYTPPPDTNAAVRSTSPWKLSYTIAIIVTTGAVLAGVLLLWYMRWQSRRSRTLLGKLLPPGIGPCTTLLVTDIQDSTGMWERLPAQMMEQTLAVHHATLQQLLGTYQGYESATEGDSFILAFHSAQDALAYAAAAQVALLHADWPWELLVEEPLASCCSVRVMHTNPDARLSKVVAGLQRASTCPPKYSHTAASTRTVSNMRHAASRRMPKPSPLSVLSSFCQQWITIKRHSSRGKVESGRGEHFAWLEHDACLDTGEVTATGSTPESAATGSLQMNANCSFGWAISQAWADLEHGGAPPGGLQSHGQHPWSDTVLVWRGLRVRMGLHSGLTDPTSISTNSTTRRAQYSGSFLATAKQVCDSGHGGQIVLSHAAFEQVAAADGLKQFRMLLMGEHVLSADQAAIRLYQAPVPGLEARLQSFPALRSKQVVSDGVMAATVGTAAVVFMNVSSVQLLMAWSADLTQQALQIYHNRVQGLLQQYGGYTPELVDGLALAVFARPADAIKWALAVHKALLLAPWPQQLLQHELCEPVMTTVAMADEAGQCSEMQKLALRGLRLKVGIATGEVLDYINPATARVMYRGRVMNWAARISALATSGQVLCSEISWLHATSTSPDGMSGISAVNGGIHMLKGVHAPLTLYSCTYTQGYNSDTLSKSRTLSVDFICGDAPSSQLPAVLECPDELVQVDVESP